jgi:hypothetical protein
MLENSTPLSRNTSDGVNVLLQGVDPGFHYVPLHHIKLKSNFVSGQVVVVEDIALLFGIDMAGDKFRIAPIGFEYLIVLFYSVKIRYMTNAGKANLSRQVCHRLSVNTGKFTVYCRSLT